MKIISWNVNGIRAVIKKGFLEFLKKEKPDVLCLQEIKISETARAQAEFNFQDYQEFWNSAWRPGYSGTATLIKNEELRMKNELVKNGIGIEKFDCEGRVQTLDLGRVYLVNTYFPNSNHELSRLDYKIEFNDKLSVYLKKLDKIKPVVICGDFNVAHQEIDLARPKENEGNPGFHPRERAWMSKFLNAGFIDTFRALHPQKVQYSWWSYRAGARARNIGWRIDYFCVSERFKKNIKGAFILDQVGGSDHCPVGIEIK